MKKILASVAVVAALSTSAVAEESGYFVGLNYGYSSFDDGISALGFGGDYNSHRYGIYGGYTQMFDSAFGARYYATLDFGSKHTSGEKGAAGVQYNLTNLYINADAIYNFNAGSSTEFGVFGGLGLGYVSGKAETYRSSESENGLGLGLNLGLRVNYELFNSKFSTELYTRTGLIDSVFKGSESQIGLRTSYNF